MPEGGYLGRPFAGFVLMGLRPGVAPVASTASETPAQGLASGLLDPAARIGAAPGLSPCLFPWPPRADALAGPSDAALAEGYR